MTERILFVDDEPHVLEGLRRTLRRHFSLHVAVGPEEGLSAIQTQGPFAVIVSDYRMPNMNGAQFLARAAELEPDSMRIMLTGHADLDVAIEAVNEGHIFRFLRKPCPTDRLTRVLQDALRHRQLMETERVLLEETLQGSLKVLAQTLSLTNPAAFGLGTRLEPLVGYLADTLKLPDGWQYRIAASVSQIGCVTLPADLVEKVYALGELSAEEQETFASHPEVGAELIAHIPRLEPVAAMIRGQDTAAPLVRPAREMAAKEPDRVGAQLLRVTIALDKVLHGGRCASAAMHVLKHEPDKYTPELVEALAGLDFVQELGPAREVGIGELLEGMILEEDVRADSGVLLMARGHEVTYAVLQRLRRLADRGDVTQKIRVRIRRTVARRRGPDKRPYREARS